MTANGIRFGRDLLELEYCQTFSQLLSKNWHGPTQWIIGSQEHAVHVLEAVFYLTVDLVSKNSPHQICVVVGCKELSHS
jgi:hypothetical protein